MLVLRLQRLGKKKNPSYRLMVSEKTKDTQAGTLEHLGTYNPVVTPKVVNLNVERIKYWISVGAQPSASVNNLLINEGIIKGDKEKSVFLSQKRKGKLETKKVADAEEKEKREEKKETVEQKREEAKERATEKLEERKLEIKEKLDQRLQERMEKLVDMLNAKNDHLTSVYLKHLERIEEILDKVLTRADKALEPDQYDALVVLAEALRAEIDVTVDLVLSQKEKVYTISAETKEEFGEAFRTVMGEFKDDHQIIRTSLRGVRDELHDFFEEVKEAIKAATPADREEQEEENEGV